MDAFAPGGEHSSPTGPTHTGENTASAGLSQGATTPPPPAPPRPYGQTTPYYGGPPPPQHRQWFPFAVVAAILFVGALIAAAIFFKGTNQSTPPRAAAPTTQTSPASAAGSSTCAAWGRTKVDLSQVTRMPSGFVYGNPGIDQLADTRAAQLNQILDTFEAQIAPTPADVAAAAHYVVKASRTEAQKLAARQAIDASDLAAIEGSEEELNHLCGMG